MANTFFPLDRSMLILPAQHGQIGDMGPAGTAQQVGTFTIQFQPSYDFVGDFGFVGYVANPPAAASLQPLPISYKTVAVNGAASDYSYSSALITGSTIVQVPSNGLSVGILVNCTGGSCWIVLQRLDGAGGF